MYASKLLYTESHERSSEPITAPDDVRVSNVLVCQITTASTSFMILRIKGKHGKFFQYIFTEAEGAALAVSARVRKSCSEVQHNPLAFAV